MNITKQLANVFVVPEQDGKQNVIRRVHWLITFEDGGYESTGFVETFLDVDNSQEFIACTQVGNSRLLEWAYAAQGGDAYLDEILPFHAEQIKLKKLRSGQVSFTAGFELVQPVFPR